MASRLRGKKKTQLRQDEYWTFDIETTTLITGKRKNGNPIRNAFIWSGQFYNGDKYIQVRTIQEVVEFLQKLDREAGEINPGRKLCVFVHNLSYEFQFIKDYFYWEKILCTEERKIISAETENLCFRCTLFLSNMKLAKFLEAENVPEEFQKSKMEYSNLRYPWTPLTMEEEIYCRNDVVGLHLAVKHRISLEKNNDINNLPMTSTGYVRRDCRTACQKNFRNRSRFLKEAMTLPDYEMCHEAFRGGNTHANKMFAGKVMKNVGQVDIVSSYSFECLTKTFPGKWYDMKCYTRKEFNFFLENDEKYGLLFEVVWLGLELKNPKATPVPYIPTSKCKKIKYDSSDNDRNKVDNGRLLKTGPMGYARMILTEVDYKIIKKQYKCRVEKIIRVKYAKKHYISDELRDKIREYFKDKTMLKQDPKDPDFDPDIDYFYRQAKSRINGVYGMHVTNIVKCPWKVDNRTHSVVEDKSKSDEELLNDYYSSWNSFLTYQIGIYVSAYARADLQECIDLLQNKKDPNKSDLIYCDTDSCKFINPEDHMDDIENLINKRKRLECEKHKAYCDRDGKRYYLGVFDDEGIADKFITFGAKKYIYGSDKDLTPEKAAAYAKKSRETDKLDSPFHITISGVNKTNGVLQILDDIAEGTLNSPFDVNKGYIFRGIKIASEYNDLQEAIHLDIDGHDIEMRSNVAIYPTSYTLGYASAYERLLEEYKAYEQSSNTKRSRSICKH